MVSNNGLIKGALRVIGTLFAKRIETDEINGITKSEINCLDNVTSNIQTQLNGKATTAQGTKADNALPRAGGTMTGNITYNMYSSTQTPVKVYGGNNNGQGISVGAGAATIVGSGESAKACEPLLAATTEQLWLTSDDDIKFYTNCQTIGNKVGVALGTGRQFYPDVNNTGSLGTSSNKWNNVYATTLTGSLSGNASTTTKLATSRTVTFTGDMTGNFSFDGSKNITANLSYTKLPKVDKVLSGIIVAPSSFANGIAKITNSYFTPYSVVDVYFDETSIPIAKKAGIIVNSENGYLELKAKKVPTASLTMETVRIMDKTTTATLNGTHTLNGDITLEGYSHTPVVQNNANHAENQEVITVGNFTFNTPSTFNTDIEMLNTTDPNSNVTFNRLIQELINNDVFINSLVSSLSTKLTALKSSIIQLDKNKVDKTGTSSFRFFRLPAYSNVLYVEDLDTGILYYVPLTVN